MLDSSYRSQIHIVLPALIVDIEHSHRSCLVRSSVNDPSVSNAGCRSSIQCSLLGNTITVFHTRCAHGPLGSPRDRVYNSNRPSWLLTQSFAQDIDLRLNTQPARYPAPIHPDKWASLGSNSNPTKFCRNNSSLACSTSMNQPAATMPASTSRMRFSSSSAVSRAVSVMM